MSYTLENNHPLIKREQTYFYDRKIISIHSCDRDYSKWPNASLFEVEVPEKLKNVSSIRLVDMILPNNLYTFTENYQNTKFEFEIRQDISGTSNEKTALTEYKIKKGTFILEINEGYYEPNELANEIENQLNDTVSQTLLDASFSIVLPTTYTYDNFRVKYNKVQNKLYILNTRDKFNLLFNKKQSYNISCSFKEVWEQYCDWGLPFNLGFEKNKYISQFKEGTFKFNYDNDIYTPDLSGVSGGIYYAISPYDLNIKTEQVIYLELDKYNSLDEIEPYSEKTTQLYNNDYASKINSAFAKIPLTRTPFNTVYEPKNKHIHNITFFKIPKQQITKFRCKFRFHNGQLVDFKRLPFTFLIEANQLVDEQKRHSSINTPWIYPI